MGRGGTYYLNVDSRCFLLVAPLLSLLPSSFFPILPVTACTGSPGMFPRGSDPNLPVACLRLFCAWFPRTLAPTRAPPIAASGSCAPVPVLPIAASASCAPAPAHPNPCSWLCVPAPARPDSYASGSCAPVPAPRFLLLGPPAAACKRKEQEQQKERALQPKKQRLVFTDLQRRTLIAIFKENKRPSKEMQVTISQQLGLELNTVSNFFMNARRRCMNRWAEEPPSAPGGPAGAAATFSKA